MCILGLSLDGDLLGESLFCFLPLYNTHKAKKIF